MHQGQTGKTVRISLGTKCPNDAGDYARYLALCGQFLRDNKVLARLRQDEIRGFVHGYFARSLKRYRHLMDTKGLSHRFIGAIKEELVFHEEDLMYRKEEDVDFSDISDQYLDSSIVKKFKEFAQLDEATWIENEADLRRELRKGRKDVIKAVLSAAERVEHYSLEDRSCSRSSL
jgi:hypothetical protein